MRITEKFRAIGRHDGQLESVGFEYNGVTFSQDTLHVFPGLCAVDTPGQRRGDLPRARRARHRHHARRRLQAAHLPVRLPGPRREPACPTCSSSPGKYGIRVIAMEVTHESHIEEIQRALGSDGQRHRRDAADRHAQRAELRAAQGRRRAERLAGAVQARHGHHARGVAQRLRVRRLRRQPPHRLRPARHEDQPRRSAPQLRRLRARAGGQAPDPPAGVRRSVALGRPARASPPTGCSTSST